MIDDRMPAVLRALADMARDVDRPPRAVAQERARNLMHAAVDRRAAAGRIAAEWVRPRWPFRRKVLFGGFGIAAAAGTTVVVLGWSAPAGSPLHEVRLVRESVALHLPGADDATLVLGYAEDRLADAAVGRDVRASVAEASALLQSCRAYLPANHADPLWERWQRDENELAQLEAAPTAPVRAGDGPGAEGPGNTDDGATMSGQSGRPGSGGSSTGGSDGRETDDDGSASASQGTGNSSHGGSSATSTTTFATSSSDTSSGGGGADGGDDTLGGGNGGSGSTSSSSTDGGH